jgi:sn-glycerol 3-phosphate transport system permease protein
MTNGGPDNASNLLLFYVYEVAFKFWDTSYAAALTFVLLVILAGLAFSQFAILERRTHYR